MLPSEVVPRVSPWRAVSWISMTEVWVVAAGGRGSWPFDADELVVFTVDVAAMGHSTSEFTGSARSHRFLQQSRVHDGPLPGAPTVGVL